MLNINSSYRNIQTQPSIGFKGLSDGNKSQTTTGADEKSQTKLGTKGKVILGTTITGLAALGIYLATRGKAKPSTIHTPSEPIPNPTEILENSLDKFKELGGKLVKGKAIDKDGNLFTGTLVKETPSGATVTLKYENGALTESSKVKNNLETLTKKYTRNEHGKITKIEGTLKDANNNVTNTFTHERIYDEGTGKLIDNGRHKFGYAEDGSLKYMSNYKVKEGGIELPECMYLPNNPVTVEFDPVIHKPIKGYCQSEDTILYFDNDGKIREAVNRVRNRKTGVVKFSLINDKDKGRIRNQIDLQNMCPQNYTSQVNHTYALENGNHSYYVHNNISNKKNGEIVNVFDMTHSGNGQSYRLTRTNGNDNIYDVTVGVKRLGGFNGETGELQMFADSGKAKEDVEPIVKDIWKNCNHLLSISKDLGKRFGNSSELINFAK